MAESKEDEKSGCGCGGKHTIDARAARKLSGKLPANHQLDLMNRIQKTANQRKNTIYKTKAPLFN